MQKIFKLFLVLIVFLLTACTNNYLNDDNLLKSIETNVNQLILNGQDASNKNDYQYKDFEYEEKELPSSYDLREKGLITSIKNQGSLGTCWAQALMAASETALLKNEELTLDEYIQQYGNEPDFSEKAFVYFSSVIEDGVNEGNIFINEGEAALYDSGGNNMIAIASLANGYGLYAESKYPYYDENGNVDYYGKWILDENDRFDTIYNVDDYNILPSPSRRNDNGEYVFDKGALNQIKQEICNNNAVIIAYHADATVAEKTYAEVKEALWDELIYDYNLSEEEAEFYIQYRSKRINLYELDVDELKELIEFKLKLNNFSSDTYDVSVMNKDDMITLLNSEYFGYNLDDILNYERTAIHYINNKSENPTNAHYTYDAVNSNHMVIVVGYDDNYSKDNFQKDHMPIADGAFICKNSWSTEWGNDGYFYLSYYDKSIEEPCTVEISKKEENYKVLTNDHSIYSDVISTFYDSQILEANIIDVNEDADIYSLSTVTDNQNTIVTYQIYELNDNYKNPTDGKLLLEIEDEYDYAGLHRIYLDETVRINKGKIAIVTSQKVGEQYVLVNNIGFSKEYTDDLRNNKVEIEHVTENTPNRYIEVELLEGTSFVSYDAKTWIDWLDIVEDMKTKSNILKYFSFDNLPSKVYILD